MSLSILPNNNSEKELLSSRDNISKENIVSSNEINFKDKFSELSKNVSFSMEQNKNTLESLQNQINGLKTQVDIISNGLVNISNLVKKDSLSEQTQLQNQLKEERTEAITGLRGRRENELEQRVQIALSKPIEKVRQKAEGIFGRLGNVIKTMLAGFLVTKGLELFKAFKDGDGEKIKELSLEIGKNIGYILSGFAAWKGGMFLLRRTLQSVLRFTFNSLRDTFKFIFRRVGNLFRNLFTNNFRKPPNAPPRVKIPRGKIPGTVSTKGNKTIKDVLKGNKGPGAKPPLGTPGNTAIPKPSTGSKFPKGGGFLKMLGRASLGLDAIFTAKDRSDKGQSLKDTTLGTAVQVGAGALAAKTAAGAGAGIGLFTGPAAVVVSPALAALFGTAAYMTASWGAGKAYDKIAGVETPNAPQPQTSAIPNDIGETIAPIAPQTSAIPNNIGETIAPIAPQTSAIPTGIGEMGEMKNSNEMDFEDFYLPDSSFLTSPESLSTNNFSFDESQISPKEKNDFILNTFTKTKIGEKTLIPPEDSKPNIIFAPSKKSSARNEASFSTGKTEVPLIRSNNPDNFYILYSKRTYNVVV